MPAGSPRSSSRPTGGRPPPAPLRPLGASYQAGAHLTRALPPAVRYRLAAAGGAAWYAASRNQRRHARVNYALVLGTGPDDPRVERVARAAFANYGRMLADFALLGSLGPDELLARVTFGGREHVEAALGGGRGCIMAAPHMGSWDMAVSFAAAAGFSVAAVVERFPGSLDQAVVETRTRFGMRVIPLGRAAVRGIREALADNFVVALLCDLPQGPGVEVEFFGRRATVPAGPAALAARHGVPVLPGFVRSTSPGRYHLHVDPPLERPDMQRITACLEAYIRAYPEHWYAFRSMFR